MWDHPPNQSITLVLPDTLRPKFYLPDKCGKRQRNAAKEMRDMERHKFLSQKNITTNKKQGKKGKVKSVCSGKRSLNINKVERDVEERLLKPLRRNNAAMNAFMERVKRIKMGRKQQNIKCMALSPPAVHTLENTNPTFSECEMGAQISEISDDNFLEQPSSARPLLIRAQSNVSNNRNLAASHWLTMIAIIQRHLHLNDVLLYRRIQFQREQVQLNGALTIQRMWRKSEYAQNMSVLVKHFLNSQGRSHGRAIYRARQDAADILINYLSTNNNFKSTMRAFYKKVIYCQKMIRVHQRVSAVRRDLLGKVFDRALSLILYHIGHILSGKSSRNLDVSPMDKLLHHNDPLVVRNILTSDFRNHLQYLSSNNSNITQAFRVAHREFVSGKWAPQSKERERAIRELLKISRRRHKVTIQIEYNRSLRVPNVSEEEVLAYIHGGEDPLSYHIEKLDEVYRLPGKHLRRHIIPPPMLMLRPLTSLDLLQAVVSVVLREYDIKRDRVKASMENAHKQRMKAEAILAGNIRSSNTKGIGINRTVSTITGDELTRAASPTFTRNFERSVTMDSDPATQQRVRDSIVCHPEVTIRETVIPSTPPLSIKPSSKPPQSRRLFVTEFLQI
eukprot:CAMPEP_0185036070 /NCGR_PEP_ID=MMETSP1103-20130426/28501_1 /TAXON_ID=36769 /ORGANISM="Paraphysomonas bandaiensis, Strain Caron Lab Isolate" /LENGTH=617 /DNA_ID=CAMNT_0027573449 /DNA_START=138 /DNA_END=1991 /DNA_ORIENTATION=-